ncbi:MAG: YIP1 family protein [Chthoniobacterales bacterium]
MTNIQVNRGETKLGIFSEEEIREGLRGGRFLPTDLYWQEGMPTWLTLAQFPGLAGTDAPLAVAHTGLPWDRRQELGFFQAFFETLKLVLLNPTAAFTNMKPEGGMTEPLIFAVIGGSIGFVSNLLFTLLMSSFGMMSDRNALAGLMSLGIGTIFIIIFMPVIIAFGLFIGAGILHLCLMLVGGAKRSFETTFRVLCFSTGSTYLLMIVPFCGGAISGIWLLIVECIGLARAHETTTGRAVFAVLLPVIVCCGGGLLLAVMFGTLGALSGINH